MAMSAVAAHKLRSALTLLGVLVGVFSIIVVMTVDAGHAKENRGRTSINWAARLSWCKPGRAIYFEGPRRHAKILAPQTHQLEQGMELARTRHPAR